MKFHIGREREISIPVNCISHFPFFASLIYNVQIIFHTSVENGIEGFKRLSILSSSGKTPLIYNAQINFNSLVENGIGGFYTPVNSYLMDTGKFLLSIMYVPK